MSPARALSQTFERFVESGKAGAALLIGCTLLALALANSPFGAAYLGFWQTRLAGLSLEFWVNEALMAVFFLLIGLELERELYVGELSSLRDALLPIFAAAGGMLVPALIHLGLNAGTPAQAGFGVPMATDIAFALGVLALLGTRAPPALKVFVVAFAVIDDLGAILVIAAFYTAQISAAHLAGALAVWAALVALNRLRVTALVPYLVGGAAMWFLMLKSGVHATLAGVLLAFAIPFSARAEDEHSPSHRLENALHLPVALAILPLFALANTGVAISGDSLRALASANGIGIAAGLVLGKPVGVVLFCAGAVAAGVCRLPAELRWPHLVGAGILGGIGFTMSIFIAGLAFAGDAAALDASKMAILLASLAAGTAGYGWLRAASPGRPELS